MSDPLQDLQFGHALRKWREAVSLTQAQLAGKVGANPSQVAQWETGVGVPTNKRCVQLARVLKRPLDEVWGAAVWQRVEPEEAEFFRRRIRALEKGELTLSQRQLVRTIGAVSASHPHLDFAGDLDRTLGLLIDSEVMEDWSVDDFHPAKPVETPLDAFGDAFQQVASLPAPAAAEVIRAFQGAARAAVAARTGVAPSRPQRW
jgi:transcriptional regulator with XRE-family HTH domain